MIEGIKLRNLTVTFPNGTSALKNCTIELKRGNTYLVTGTTASGKSTLLRFLKGIVPLFYPATIQGEILINDNALAIEEFWENRNRMGYLFQDPPLQMIGSSVERDLAFGLENLALEPAMIRKKIDEMAQRLGITHLMTRSPRELSGGEVALVALASILVLQPQLWLLDEFTAFLDVKARKRVIQTIEAARTSDQIVLIVSHHLADILPITDEVIVLDKGEVVLQVAGERFFSHHTDLIEPLLRIPEFYSIGASLCKSRGIDPIFGTSDELRRLLRGENID
ncbi:MAG: energy-coupling factor ABC transporter ATP-binding protein [Candidatus Heimdallarchaeota archaeon]